MQWRGWPQTPYVLPYQTYHTKPVVLAQTVLARVRENPKIENGGPYPLGWRVWLAELGYSASRGMGINRVNPKNWVSLGPRLFGMSTWVTPRNMPLPHRYYHAKLVHFRSSGTICQKNWHRIYSRALKVIRTDMDWFGYLWLHINDP